MSEIINTDSAAKPLGAYPHARRAGNLLFLSGIGAGMQQIIRSPAWNWTGREIYLNMILKLNACRYLPTLKRYWKPAAAVGKRS